MGVDHSCLEFIFTFHFPVSSEPDGIGHHISTPIINPVSYNICIALLVKMQYVMKKM